MSASAVMVMTMLLYPAVCLAQQRQAATEPAVSVVERNREIAQRRADRILKELALTEEAKARKVRDIIVSFYLRRIGWGPNDKRIKELASKLSAAKKDKDQAKAEEIQKHLKALSDELSAMRTELLADLVEVLTGEQIEVVKNVMTYKKVPLLYESYRRKNPLTSEQKAIVLRLLKDARENAMIAGSSGDKHAIFNKAVGRVNIYLDAQKKLQAVLADIEVGKLDEAAATLTKLENSHVWLREAMARQLAAAREAFRAAQAGTSAAETQPAQPVSN